MDQLVDNDLLVQVDPMTSELILPLGQHYFLSIIEQAALDMVGGPGKPVEGDQAVDGSGSLWKVTRQRVAQGNLWRVTM